MSWVVNLNVGNERDLVAWSVQQVIWGNLLIWSIDLIGKTLGDGTSVGPYEFTFSISVMGDSSWSWWKNTWGKLEIFVIFMPPLPGINISAVVESGFVWMAFTIFGNTSWSVLGDVVFFAYGISDVVMNLSDFKSI
jgi:hypothetical protein